MKAAHNRSHVAEATSKSMSVPEAAREYLGITSKDGAYAAAHAGIIPFIRVGRLLRVPRAAMEQRMLQAGQSATTNAA
jgi:excisionase family DNA binding protein